MVIKRLLFAITGMLAMALLSLLIFFIIILAGHYVIDEEKLSFKQTTTLVGENGHVITKLFIEHREPVPLNVIPDHVKEAFIAIEDARFYDHFGIDFRAIIRALYRDILAGEKVEGGSTITQQLAKRVFLTNEKTFLRKTKEVLIAINLERRYSKDEILEMYLNEIYFGHGAYGIQAASKFYFNKDVSELTIEEGALLAALPKAPNTYSPLVDEERSKQRRNIVLSVMEREGYIHKETAEQLKLAEIVTDVIPLPGQNEAYYTYIDMVIDEATERYGISNEQLLTGGYTIVVPMDPYIQQKSYEKIIDDNYFPSGNEDAEASFVLLDAKSGGVLAVQGGREYVRLGLNRVNVKRQPGSTFKPLAVYAPALEEGKFQPYSLLKDEQIDYDGYAPKNYDHTYRGTVTMYDAIKDSVNASAVWLLHELGVDKSLQLLSKLGFNISDQGLAIALGGLTEGVTPLELASAYQVFANEGKRVTPYFIKEIYDDNGEKIGEVTIEEERIISEQTAWYMTRMLEAVVREGTARDGSVNSALAGKTGTTTFPSVEGATMDAWFVGYTPTVVGALRIGYDVTSTEHFLHGGSTYPTILFKEIVNDLPEERRMYAFNKPFHVLELPPPVQLPLISDLQATLVFGKKGFMSIELTWTVPDDERITYEIYEISGGKRTLIDTVSNTDHYYVKTTNPFTKRMFEIVPYDTVTKRYSEASNVAEVEVKFWFR